MPPPDRADKLKHGEYLVTIGGCADCHTPMEKGQPVPGKTLAGGQVFAATIGTVVTADITPDIETGIGKWSEEFFRKKFYDYKEYAANGPPKRLDPTPLRSCRGSASANCRPKISEPSTPTCAP